MHHSCAQLYTAPRAKRPMWPPLHEGSLEIVQLVHAEDTPALIKQQLNEQTIKA